MRPRAAFTNWQPIIYRLLIQLNIKNTNNSIKKLAEDINGHFSKEDIQMDKRYMKRYSTSLIIRDANQIYNEVSPHISQNGHHQSLQTINAGEGMEKREPFYTINESVNRCSHYEEQYGGKNRATMHVCMLSHYSHV